MKILSARKRKWIEKTSSKDRSYKRFLYNRVFIFAMLVLLQMAAAIFAAYALVYTTKFAVYVQMALFAVQIVCVFRLINKNDRPTGKLGWIIAILLVPVVGVPSYFLYGENRPTRKMNKKLVQAKAENSKRVEELQGERPLVQPQTRGEGISRYLAKEWGYSAYFSGDVTYYKSGEEMFEQMKEEIKKAEKFILFEYFIIGYGRMWEELKQLLLEKAVQGVQVRIIYDDYGCLLRLPPKYYRYLESLHENIKAMTFNHVVPIFTVRMNNRDHRKLLVIDGKVGFTGGVNIADEYINEKSRFGYWKDTGIKIKGDAVQSFTEMFLYMWNAFREDKEDIQKYLLPLSKESDGKVCIQPYDDSAFDAYSVGEWVYRDILNRAKKYVYIFTPYLLLDDSMRQALCDAALRGVDVRIVTPGIPDKKMTYRLTRANYDILMRAGVKIYEYTPGFIHAKSMVCDDECAVVGTINLDNRSLYLNFENAVYFSGCEAVIDVKKDCEEVFAVSELCTPENRKRSIYGRFVDAVMRIFETML